VTLRDRLSLASQPPPSRGAGSIRDLPAFLDHAPVCVARFDRALRHVYANRAAAAAAGAGVDALLGRTPREVGFPEPACSRLEAALRHALATHGVHDVEIEVPVPGRGTRLFSVRVVGEGDSVVALSRDITDERQVAERERRARVLDQTSKLLETALDPERTLTAIARLLVPELGDYCAVALQLPDGRRARSTEVAVLPEHEEILRRLAAITLEGDRSAFSHRAMDAGRTLVVEDVQEEIARWPGNPQAVPFLRALGVRSLAAVPILARERVLGSIVLGMSVSGRRHQPADVAMVEEIARRAGLALDLARMHEARAQEEARFKAVMRQMPGGVVIRGADGRLILANDWARESGAVEALDAVRPTSPIAEDVIVRQPGGAEAILRLRGAPIHDESGALTAHALVFEDVTERRRATEAMRESRERLRAIVENAPALVLVKDREGRYLVANAPTVEALGLPPGADVVGRSDAEFFDAATAERLRAVTEEVILGGRAQQGTMTLPSPRGPRTYLASRFPLAGPEGTTHAMGVVAVDVTEREDLLRMLEAERARLQVIVRQVPVGLLIVGAQKEVILVNDRFHEILGAPPGAIRALQDLSRHPRRNPRTLEVYPTPATSPLVRALAGEHLRAEEMDVCREDGVWVSTSVSASPVQDPSGAVIAAVVVVEDLTELKRAQRDLDAARREVAHSEKLSALGSLVAGVAHEVRTPLAYITNNLFLVQQRLARAVLRGELPASVLDEVKPSVAAAVEGVDRIGYLVKELRRFTRLEGASRSIVPLREAVAEAAALFRSTHPGQPIALRLAEAGAVVADRAQVQQVVLNLLENAAEAMGPQEGLELETLAGPSGPTLRVRDRGPGIPDDVAARMFDPFFTTKAEGTGLGLAIVRRIVEQHGGSIRWEGAPGGGTTFEVTLPAA